MRQARYKGRGAKPVPFRGGMATYGLVVVLGGVVLLVIRLRDGGSLQLPIVFVVVGLLSLIVGTTLFRR